MEWEDRGAGGKLDEQAFPTLVMPPLYRERTDAESSFGELKNQWGWNGYTTRSLGPARLMANLVALFYNWWNLYVRFYDVTHHREAITSRPAQMQGVARQMQGGGQRKMKISLVHEKAQLIMEAVGMISSQLHQFVTKAEGWTIEEWWTTLLTHLFRRWLGGMAAGGADQAGRILLG